MEHATTQTTQLQEDKFFKVFWDESNRIIGIDWKEATSSMTDEEFKAELTLFAGQVEQKKARGILVDVSGFRHRPGPDVQPWRVKNISNRYAAAGVGRFAFLFPEGAQIPPMMNQSSPGESFLTRAFTNRKQAVVWLCGQRWDVDRFETTQPAEEVTQCRFASCSFLRLPVKKPRAR